MFYSLYQCYYIERVKWFTWRWLELKTLILYMINITCNSKKGIYVFARNAAQRPARVFVYNKWWSISISDLSENSPSSKTSSSHLIVNTRESRGTIGLICMLDDSISKLTKHSLKNILLSAYVTMTRFAFDVYKSLFGIKVAEG